ncbi:biopolymer transporter ExbD [uncultured Paludibaculum sp.]|uniref:ExbD/TolR family protein n=1 Tax=uncultured Paludibaculum sp. TaxID=1765020 RepID=UPI002AAA8873|nr:biopolymer transporter ExbD [uncultured Paludibaculum sp.]
MAFSMNNGGFGRRNGRGGGALAEINIVPLVDVVLVLLVIFMLTAHVVEFGLEVEVPKVKQVKESAQELPTASLDRTGNLFLNEKQVNINELGSEFKRRFPNAKAVYLRADRHTIYDPIAQVVSTLGQAGLDVRLVTQPDDSGPAK